jgi:hypothetical protein
MIAPTADVSLSAISSLQFRILQHLARKLHPDVGGSAEDMYDLNTLADAARARS